MDIPRVFRLQGESLREYNKRRWQLRRGPQKRAKTLKKRKCAFCTILLKSQYVAKKSRKYCDTCRADKGIRRYLRALYQSRWYNKKHGNEQPSLTIAE